MTRNRIPYRAAAAEEEIRELAKQAEKAIADMNARSLHLDVALQVMIKHGLIEEYAKEVQAATSCELGRDQA